MLLSLLHSHILLSSPTLGASINQPSYSGSQFVEVEGWHARMFSEKADLHLEFSQACAEKPYFTNHDIICGLVTLSCKEETHLYDLTVSLAVIETVQMFFFDAKSQISSRDVRTYEKQVLFPADGLGLSSGSKTIKAGTHRFPFHLSIPEKIPSTVAPVAYRTKVLHRVRACVNRTKQDDIIRDIYVTVYPVREKLSFPLELFSTGLKTQTISGYLPGAKEGISFFSNAKKKVKVDIQSNFSYPQRIIQGISQRDFRLYVKCSISHIFRLTKLEVFVNEEYTSLLDPEGRFSYMKCKLSRELDITIGTDKLMDLSHIIQDWVAYGCAETQKAVHMKVSHTLCLHATFECINKTDSSKVIRIESPCKVLSPAHSCYLPEDLRLSYIQGLPYASNTPPAYDGPELDFDDEKSLIEKVAGTV